MRFRFWGLVAVCFLCASPAQATLVDLTDLSTLPSGVTATMADADNLVVTVDGAISDVTVEAFLEVGGVPTVVDPFLFIMGTIFFRSPETTLTGIEVTPSLTGPTTYDIGAIQDGVNYLRVSNYSVYLNAQLLGLATLLSVDPDSIRYHYQATSMNYTPTNVPEPATGALLGVAALTLCTGRFAAGKCAVRNKDRVRHVARLWRTLYLP